MADQSEHLPEIDYTSVDSGALSGLAAIIHRFETPGQVTATVLHGEKPLRQVTLLVPPGRGGIAGERRLAASPAGEAAPGEAIDLFELAQNPPAAAARAAAPLQAAEPAPAGTALNESGYGMFCAMRATEGVAFVAQPAAQGVEPYDSRQLVAGDYFAVTLLRPGTYTVRNLVNGTEGLIALDVPAGGVGRSYVAPDTLTVECGANGFTPTLIQLKPLQGLAFRCTTPARIKIDWQSLGMTV